MTLALKYPKRISKLVVVDISPLNLGGDFDLMKSKYFVQRNTSFASINVEIIIAVEWTINIIGYLEALRTMKFDSGITLSEARKYADSQLMSTVTVIHTKSSSTSYRLEIIF